MASLVDPLEGRGMEAAKHRLALLLFFARGSGWVDILWLPKVDIFARGSRLLDRARMLVARLVFCSPPGLEPHASPESQGPTRFRGTSKLSRPEATRCKSKQVSGLHTNTPPDSPSKERIVWRYNFELPRLLGRFAFG